jgi:Nif-specific regulatory protein
MPDVDNVPPGDLVVNRDSLARTTALERLEPFLSTRCHVVFEGEAGVGKRFHAALLHEHTNGRANDKFVVLTSETSEDILRALLFGEDRKKQEGKIGKPIATLDGRSTLFLESVSQFSLMNQILLSRFLIEHGQRPAHASARLMVSTTVLWSDLLRKLADSFAQSLQHFELCRIPPLRERFAELPSLVEEILAELRQRERVDCWRVTEEVLQKLEIRQWRDNIRELKYVVEGAAFNSSDGTLRLPSRLADEIEIVWEALHTIQAGKRLALDHSLAALEKAVVERALLKCNFDQRKAARMLEMTEPNLTYRLKKFNIYIPSTK